MRLKVDENIGRNGTALLRSAGHDVATVLEQKLGGAPDETVFAACTSEGRALITLDRDFGNLLRFPPQQAAGIVVIDLGGPASLGILLRRLRDFLALAEKRDIAGELWIIERGRIRVRPAKGG